MAVMVGVRPCANLVCKTLIVVVHGLLVHSCSRKSSIVWHNFIQIQTCSNFKTKKGAKGCI